MPTLVEFLQSPMTDDIMSIPGICKYNHDMFRKNGIETSHQLLGMFLLIKGDGKFSKWLTGMDITNIDVIIDAIEEKINMWIRPEIHDED